MPLTSAISARSIESWMQSENPSRLERARRFGGASGRGLSVLTPSVQLAIGEHLLRRKLGQCSISLERQAAALEDFAVRLPYNADDFYLPLNLPAAPCADSGVCSICPYPGYHSEALRIWSGAPQRLSPLSSFT